MQILTLIGLGTFFILSVLFLIFYIKERNKNDKMASNLKKLEDDLVVLNNKYKIAVEDLKPKKIGYYKGTINLVDKDDPKNNNKNPYDYVVYIKEVEKYTNGDCKISLDHIDVIAGFDPHQYDWIKRSVTMRFPTLMKISDIEWLETEDDLKELRKQKLEKLNSKIIV